MARAYRIDCNAFGQCEKNDQKSKCELYVTKVSWVQALPSKNTSILFLANSDDEGLVYVVNGWNLVASDEQVKNNYKNLESNSSKSEV